MNDRRGPVSPARVLELGREARELVDEVVNAALQLNARRTTSRITGYRRSSRFIDGSGAGGHGDPVGETVANALDADETGPARRAYVDASSTLETIVILLQGAQGAAASVLHPRPVGPVDEGCTSCAAHGFLNVPTRTAGSDLCRWCADFWRRYKQRPSKADIQAREDRRVHVEQMRAAA